MFFCMEHILFSLVVGASPPGFARPPNLSFGLPEFGWYHFAAAPYCAIYMRESVEAMYIYVAPFANTRRSFVFVRFCDSDAHLCSRTGLFANSSFVFVRDPHFREHRPLELDPACT